jgi:predicted ATPase/transcriptional regulator with XRE-family HTH domain
MSLEEFRNRVRELRRPTGESQEALARALGMHPTVLSSKLNGTGVSLSNPETKKIIQTLAEWDGITTRAEAVELLALLNLKPSVFSAEEWDSPPLSRLEKGSASLAGLAFSPTGDIPGTPQHNLPNPATPLVGRAREVEVVSNLLRQTDARLVTLTGPGGTGKTRLAIQIGKSLLAHFSGGIFLVSLAPITDPALVPSAIARALGVREAGSRTLEDTLKDVLRDRHILLILDNFEQVTPAASHIGDLLEAAPDLKVLVTSRALLRLYGEYEFVVPPLALPDRTPGALLSTSDMLKFPAVTLFVQRARAAKASFELTPANAPAVAEICARLDGLPLAMELAAARVKLFSPHAMLSRLGSRLTLLTGGARNLDPRHQTLRSAIDWSYNLLDPDEQALFASISVFSGGCTLQAVEAICSNLEFRIANFEFDRAENKIRNSQSEIPNPFDLLTSLLDKSMLRQEEDESGEPRFLMLETIREYASEQLVLGGVEKALRQQHALYYLEFAEAVDVGLRGPEQLAWLARAEREHDNLRAALGWSLENGQVEIAARLGISLWLFWYAHGHLSEGRRWLSLALDMLSRTPAQDNMYAGLRARLLYSAGMLASYQGDFTASLAHFEESLTLGKELGSNTHVAYARSGQGWVMQCQADYEQSRVILEEALAGLRAIGDKWTCAQVLNILGFIAQMHGDGQDARALYSESLALYQELGSRWGSRGPLTNLGWVTQLLGDYRRGAEYYVQSLEIAREIGDKWGTGEVLHRLGQTEFYTGNYSEAAPPLEEALSLFKELGDKYGIAWALHMLGQVKLSLDAPDSAEAYQAESLTLFQELGEKFGTAWSMRGLGQVALYRGDVDTATSHLTQSLDMAREQNERLGIILALNGLAQLALKSGDHERADAMLRECVALAQQSEMKRRIAMTLTGLAAIASVMGRPEQAAKITGAVEAALSEMGAPMEPIEALEYNRQLALARGQVPEQVWAAAQDEGRGMSLQDAVVYALDLTGAPLARS